MKYCDPLREPVNAFGELEVDKYKAELDLVDRYQAFVAELLRLSLLGIAVFGFLHKSLFKGSDTACVLFNFECTICLAKQLAATGVLIFGICAASALIFRYCATEGARFYIEALRFVPGDDCRAKQSLEKRHRKIIYCIISKAIAAISLGLASILIAVAFCLLVMHSGQV